MAAKKKAAPRKTVGPTPIHPAIAVARTATRSLVNMIVVTAACATTWLALMAVLKYQLA